MDLHRASGSRFKGTLIEMFVSGAFQEDLPESLLGVLPLPPLPPPCQERVQGSPTHCPKAGFSVQGLGFR